MSKQPNNKPKQTVTDAERVIAALEQRAMSESGPSRPIAVLQNFGC